MLNWRTGELDIIGSSRHRITLALYKDQQTIYTVTTDSSPGDITKYYPQFWNSNEFLNFVDSPYHGEYDIGNKLWIEPSGNNIFNEWGNVFKVGDLIFVKKVLPSDIIAKELAFDSTNNRVVLIERNFNGVTDVISSYDLPEYDNYQVLKTGASAAQFIFNDNGHILLIEKLKMDIKYVKYSIYPGFSGGLLGYTSVGGEASYEGESEDIFDDGFSYGGGAGVIFGKVNFINVEWKNLAKTDSGDITGLSVSFQRNF